MGIWDKATISTVCNLLILVIVMLIVLIGLASGVVHKMTLDDPNNIRRYQVGLGGVSLDDQVYDASQKKSGLTGSRDIPVFFQDYDYEMIKKGANMYTSREGLSDERSPESEIEKRMLGG